MVDELGVVDVAIINNKVMSWCVLQLEAADLMCDIAFAPPEDRAGSSCCSLLRGPFSSVASSKGAITVE